MSGDARHEAVALHRQIEALYEARDAKIAEAVAAGAPVKELAAELGVTRQHVYAIAAGRGVRAPHRPSLADVGRAAGVSRQTASRALRGGPYVRDATRDLVLTAAREIGYS